MLTPKAPLGVIAAYGTTNGRVTQWFDASNRRYTFTYTTFSGLTRLQTVVAEIQSGGSWTSPILVGQVDYGYYTSTTANFGSTGDLQTVEVTLPIGGGSNYIRTKYYRYYTSWANNDGERGNARQIKMVVGFEGVRQDSGYATDPNGSLKPHSEMYFEYPSSGHQIPRVDSTSTYPSGSALTTSYSYTFWSGSSSPVQYLAPQSVTTTNPIVTTGHNGSNSATTRARYLRADGTTALTQDETGVLFYAGRDADNRGQTAVRIADANTSTTGDFVAEDLVSGTGPANLWSVSSGGRTPIHAKTTFTYDDQGRMLTRTAPAHDDATGATRTSTWAYALDGAQLATFMSPLLDLSGNYHGPLSYTRVNHAGKQDRRAIIQIGTPANTIPTSMTPTTSSGTAWSAQVDTAYDASGMRPSGWCSGPTTTTTRARPTP